MATPHHLTSELKVCSCIKHSIRNGWRATEVCCNSSPATQLHHHHNLIIRRISMLRDSALCTGPGFDLPAHFSPIYFPMGNAATGFFVTFSLIAGVVGVASVIAGLGHVRLWSHDSLPGAASAATIAWSLTLLAMGFACKEIQLEVRNARLVSKL